MAHPGTHRQLPYVAFPLSPCRAGLTGLRRSRGREAHPRVPEEERPSAVRRPPALRARPLARGAEQHRRLPAQRVPAHRQVITTMRSGASRERRHECNWIEPVATYRPCRPCHRESDWQRIVRRRDRVPSEERRIGLGRTADIRGLVATIIRRVSVESRL